MSNLGQRVLFGALGAAVLLLCIWFSAWTFALFFGLVQMRMLWEFYRMMRKAGYKPASLLGGGISLMLFGVVFSIANAGLTAGGYSAYPPLDAAGGPAVYGNSNGQLAITAEQWQLIQLTPLLLKGLVALVIILPIVLILREMYAWPRKNKDLAPFANVGVALLGLLYVSLPMSLLSVLAFNGLTYDYRRVFGLLLLVWASDIGAYAAGKSWGRHKLAPSISPGKTWEGVLGGFLLTLGVGAALGYLLPDLPLPVRLVAAGVVAVFGPLGDLAESMLKRSVDVKDSGRILPGHGGLLDRFDAFLFVVPVLVVVQLLFGQ